MSTWVLSVAGALAAGYLLVVGLKFGFLRIRGLLALRRALAARRPRNPMTTRPRLTFICPVTRPEVARRILESGLDDLDEPVQRLLIDNTGSGARVAAVLFNDVGPRVDTPFVAFCHQDWRPIDRDWVARTLEVFEAHPACEMVAQVGVMADRQGIGGLYLDPHGPGGKPGDFLLHAPDEQCFVLRVSRLRELPFDEANLPEFHFYAVDYGCELQKRGFEVRSTPALGYHGSAAGALTSKSFRRARAVLRAKYGSNRVRATTGWL
jgi:hypothetical protein